MSVATQAFKGASWLAVFKFTGQFYSWTITILVARILLPDEYGLYAMAFLITGYAEMFSQLGLGSAIIQRQDINQKEISSVFWFSVFVSVLFALACMPLSYLTAYIFNEPRIIPLTQSISILFILSGLQIVPLSLLKKDLAFKRVGQFELTCVIIQGLSMLVIAYNGGGVWALIGGRIIFAFVMVILLYSRVKWLPMLHYSYSEAKTFIKFGLAVASGGSMFYISENSDRFFAARSLGVTSLGFYSFAMQLAKIPTDKIVALINQVSYPAFAKLQGDQEQFNKFYLDIVKVTATIVMPVFFGGYMLGGDLVMILLGEKWAPIIYIFEFLCLSQIITALNAYNNFVHDARGKPRYSLFFNFLSAVSMVVAFYFAVQHGLNAMLVPWFTVYLLISIFWILFTLNQLGINGIDYLKQLFNPTVAALLMSLIIYLFVELNKYYLGFEDFSIVYFFIKMIIAIIVYCGYFWIFDRNVYYSIKKLRSV